MAKVTNPVSFVGMTPIDAERQAIVDVWLSKGFKLTPISPTRTPVRPRLSITNPDFDYVPARATNVAETWRRFGWKAPMKAPK